MQGEEKESNVVKMGKGISGSTIKIIAIAAMLIDHISAALITRILIQNGFMNGIPGEVENGRYVLLYVIMIIMRLIGRIGFPIFCFLLVEGFVKTRSRVKYALRLGIFALVSEVPFDLALGGSVFYPHYQNVFFTLLIGLLLMWCFELLDGRKDIKWLQRLMLILGILLLPLYCGQKISGFLGTLLSVLPIELPPMIGYVIFAVIALGLMAAVSVMLILVGRMKGRVLAGQFAGYAAILAVAMELADLLKTDYAWLGVLTIAVMYLLRRNHVLSMTAGCGVLTIFNMVEATSFAALIPISKYNGQRGLRMKYFFYAFYPLHLLIIWLIAVCMGMGDIPAI